MKISAIFNSSIQPNIPQKESIIKWWELIKNYYQTEIQFNKERISNKEGTSINEGISVKEGTSDKMNNSSKLMYPIYLIRKTKINGIDVRGKLIPDPHFQPDPIPNPNFNCSIICADNAPAWAIYDFCHANIIPNNYEFQNAFIDIEQESHFGYNPTRNVIWNQRRNYWQINLNNNIFQIPTHMFQYNYKVYSQYYNKNGFHIAHIFNINDGTNPNNWTDNDIKIKSLKFLSPLNMFPITINNWQQKGGDPNLLNYMKIRYKMIFGQYWDEFLELINICWFEDLLKKDLINNGFTKNQHLSSKFETIYSNNMNIIIICPLNNINSQNSLNNYLRNLLNRITSLINAGYKIDSVYFPGSGSLTLPDWFKNALNKLNIKIIILNLDDFEKKSGDMELNTNLNQNPSYENNNTTNNNSLYKEKKNQSNCLNHEEWKSVLKKFLQNKVVNSTNPEYCKFEDRNIVFWKATRLYFKKEGIDKLESPYDLIVIKIETETEGKYKNGYYIMTKSEFDEVFGNSKNTKSWTDKGIYHYSNPPLQFSEFFIA